jgi:phospholipase/carboxylesterase
VSRPPAPLRHLERPATGEPEGALVFLHGYYGLPDDFLPLLDKLDPRRRLHGFLPEAPVEVAEGRTAWWVDDDGRPELQVAPAARWLSSLPFPPGRIVVGGWSQGAAVAYALALGAGRPRPAGVLALGGTLFERPELDLARPLPPVAIAHGRRDDVVPVESARRARDVLEGAGARVIYLETEIGHELDQAVVPQLRDFVASALDLRPVS